MLILSDLEEAFPVSVRAVYDTLAVDRGFRTSSDGVELGVRAPRVLDPPLDLQLPLCPRPRCARSLLISVVSIDGSESGIGLVLVRGSIWVAPERNVVETRLLLAVLSLLPSLIPDFSLDRALSLFAQNIPRRCGTRLGAWSSGRNQRCWLYPRAFLSLCRGCLLLARGRSGYSSLNVAPVCTGGNATRYGGTFAAALAGPLSTCGQPDIVG